MPLDVKLVVVGGDVKTTELKLRLPSTIGRGRDTSIVLPHPLVSRRHCELFEAEGRLMVRDLGSLNGTFVNNQRITESPLPPGELLTIGTVTFRAVYDAAAGPANGAPETVRTAPGEKTLPASKAPTVRAAPKETAQPAERKSVEPAHSDSEVLEFNFGQPLLPGDDDDDLPASSAHPTERLTETIQQPKPAKPAPAKAKPSDAAVTGQPPPTKAAPAKAAPDDVTLPAAAEDDFEADEGAAADDDVPSDSDDDLNDFLQSLK